MKIILAVGAPGAGHEAVFDYLVKAGLSAAKPSRRDGHTPQALSRLILQALEVNPSRQVPKQQLSVGRMWGELASDLALANLDRQAWGWSDHQLGWLMDFWQDFDPNVRILLVYSSPVDHVAQSLQGSRVQNAAQVETALRTWTEWNTALLRYHLRHPDRSMLVHAREVLRDPKAFREKLGDTWGVKGLKGFDREVEKVTAGGALLAHAVQALVPAEHAARALEQQLDNAAQFPAPDSGSAAPDSVAAWNLVSDLVGEQRDERGEAQARLKAVADETLGLKAQLGEAQQVLKQRAERIEALEAKLAEVKGEVKHRSERIEVIDAKLAEVKAEVKHRGERIEAIDAKLAEVKAEVKRRGERIEALDAKLAEVKAEAAAAKQQLVEARAQAGAAQGSLQQENELLLGQLHQVQEDLEQYFLKAQQLEAARQQSEAQEQQAASHSAELQARVSELEGQYAALDEHARDLVQQLGVAVQRQLTDGQQQDAETQQWLAQANEQQAALQQQLAQAHEHHSATQQQLAQVHDLYSATQQQLAEMHRQLAAAQAGLAQAEDQNRRLRDLPPPPVADPVLEFEANFWRSHPPEVVTLDLRQPIRGEGWYGAEFDGRWTGPESTSTLELPALPAGAYLLEMDVIGTVSADALVDAYLTAQGRAYPLLVEFLGDAGALPAVCSATVGIDADESTLTLALHLGSTALPEQSPDAPDDRQLGARIQQIRLTRQIEAPLAGLGLDEPALEVLATA